MKQTQAKTPVFGTSDDNGYQFNSWRPWSGPRPGRKCQIRKLIRSGVSRGKELASAMRMGKYTSLPQDIMERNSFK